MAVVVNLAYVIMVIWLHNKITECNARVDRAEAMLRELYYRIDNPFASKE